jgi:hypothetical protein
MILTEVVKLIRIMSHLAKRKAQRQEAAAATTSREVGKTEEVATPVEEVLPVAAEDATDAPAEVETAVEEETLPVEEEADREAAPEESAATQATDILADLDGKAEDGQEKITTEIEETKDIKEESEPTTGLLCCA